MKLCFFLLSTMLQLSCFGQFDKSVTLNATINFDATLNGLATNDVGSGLGIDASFFSKHRLHALIETSADWFFGDKLLVYDSTIGKSAKSAAVYSIKAGPQFFVTKHIALSATYGPAWHVVRNFRYSLDDGFKLSVTAFMGNRRHFVTRLFLVDIPSGQQTIRYVGLAVGVRW